MGAGKSTFAGWLLEALNAERPPEGSPTFPLVHRYPRRGQPEVIHIDLYRLKSEEEIEGAGILEDLWNRDAIVLVEWLSLWPGVEQALFEDAGRRKVQVFMGLDAELPSEQRSLRIHI